MNLGESKVESLILHAAVYARDGRERTVKGVGIRIHKVQIVDEGDCIKVKA